VRKVLHCGSLFCQLKNTGLLYTRGLFVMLCVFVTVAYLWLFHPNVFVAMVLLLIMQWIVHLVGSLLLGIMNYGICSVHSTAYVMMLSLSLYYRSWLVRVFSMQLQIWRMRLITSLDVSAWVFWGGRVFDAREFIIKLLPAIATLLLLLCIEDLSRRNREDMRNGTWGGDGIILYLWCFPPLGEGAVLLPLF